MVAKVKPECRFTSITAFGGRDYFKDHWMLVPPECEEEAKRHEYLDTADVAPVEVPVEHVSKPSPEPAPSSPRGDPMLPSDARTETQPSTEPVPNPLSGAPDSAPPTSAGKGKNK